MLEIDRLVNGNRLLEVFQAATSWKIQVLLLAQLPSSLGTNGSVQMNVQLHLLTK